jgi:putative dimethyl sulfoxide reductase chaperone
MPKVKTEELSKKESRQFTGLGEIAGARSNLYRFFGGFYADAPSEESIANMTSDEFVAEMVTLFGKRATEPLVRFAEKYEPQGYEDLTNEFSQLFVVPLEQQYVTPYESVYLTGLMVKEPHFKVKTAYKKAGVEFTPDKAATLEDHISAELNFMAYLSEEESKAWSAGDKTQAMDLLNRQVSFLEEHLTLWVHELCRKIEDLASVPLFTGVAKMTSRYVDLDYTQTADLLDKLEEESTDR